MAELVDARDLKSLSYGYPGSIPGVRTILILLTNYPFFFLPDALPKIEQGIRTGIRSLISKMEPRYGLV